MEVKAEHPARFVEGKVAPLMRAYFEINQLKLLFRQGWLKRQVPSDQCESVAEHSFGVAMMAMFLADTHFPELDIVKVVRMALLHDLGEVYAGDLTPSDGVSGDDKYEREKAAVCRVLEGLAARDLYLEIWEEYEQGLTPESRFIRRIDRLEMALQARVYECAQGLDLSEFYHSASKYMDDPKLEPLFKEILNHREQGTSK